MTGNGRSGLLGSRVLGVAALAAALALPASARQAPELDSSLNLHNHSYCSDGSDTPEALVELAARTGIKVLGITDHDNVNCVARAREAARKAGIQLVPGIEISAGDDSMHILGLSVDIEHPELRGLMEGSRKARLERSKEILAKLSKLTTKDGRPIQISLKELLIEKLRLQNSADGLAPLSPDVAAAMSEEQLLSKISAPMTRPDVAVMMVKKGYVPNTRVAFDVYLGDEGGAASELDGPSFAETIRIVHAAGGIAILAHPYTIYKGKTPPFVIEGKPYPRFEALLDVLFKAGLDGVEQYKNNGKGTVPWIVDAAQSFSAQSKRSIVLTPGSDYHGSSGVGQAHLDSIGIPKDEAERLRQALKIPDAPMREPVFTAESRVNLQEAIQSQQQRFGLVLP